MNEHETGTPSVSFSDSNDANTHRSTIFQSIRVGKRTYRPLQCLELPVQDRNEIEPARPHQNEDDPATETQLDLDDSKLTVKCEQQESLAQHDSENQLEQVGKSLRYSQAQIETRRLRREQCDSMFAQSYFGKSPEKNGRLDGKQ